MTIEGIENKCTPLHSCLLQCTNSVLGFSPASVHPWVGSPASFLYLDVIPGNSAQLNTKHGLIKETSFKLYSNRGNTQRYKSSEMELQD